MGQPSGGTSRPPATPRPLSAYLPLLKSMVRDEFVRVYHTPVLLVSAAEGATDAGGFDTRVLSVEEVKRAMAAAARAQLVFPIMKRTSDAFQSFVWVGRDPNCDVPLPFDGISKLQAQFVLRQDSVTLIDVGSRNGTFVDGTRLERNQPVPMNDGALIHFGRLAARFRTAVGLWEELRRI